MSACEILSSPIAQLLQFIVFAFIFMFFECMDRFFVWHMHFFMISWKYACFPYYFWKNKNLRLSVRVENDRYIHFLASNKSKLPSCHSRKLIRALTMSKNSFWTRFCHILAYFYKPNFLQYAENMQFDFVEYSTSPVEISDFPTKIFEISKLRRWL